MTRTAPPPVPPTVGQVTTSANAPNRDRPGFTAELVDDDRGGRIYRISDQRGYTLAHDTVRIEQKGQGLYLVWTLNRREWALLLEGGTPPDVAPWREALARAFRVLYGEEDHG